MTKFRVDDGDKVKFDQILHESPVKKFDSNLHYPLHKYPIYPEDKINKKNLKCNFLYLNGIHDYVNCGNNAILNPLIGDFSFGAWIKTTATSGYILAKVENENRYFLGMTGTGEIRFQLKDGVTGSAVYVITDEPYNDDTWHHVFVTIDRDVADGANIYIDSHLKKSSNPTGVDNINPSNNLCIGSWTGGSTNLKCSIKKVLIYKRNLSSTEVTSLYKGKSISNKNLILDLPITSDYSNKTVIVDESENKNNGTLHGCTWNCKWIKEV